MRARLIVAAATTLVTSMAHAQVYPGRPLLIIPAQPGDGDHFQMLTIKELLENRLGQPVVLESRAAEVKAKFTAMAILVNCAVIATN